MAEALSCDSIRVPLTGDPELDYDRGAMEALGDLDQCGPEVAMGNADVLGQASVDFPGLGLEPFAIGYSVSAVCYALAEENLERRISTMTKPADALENLHVIRLYNDDVSRCAHVIIPQGKGLIRRQPNLTPSDPSPKDDLQFHELPFFECVPTDPPDLIEA